MVKPFKKLNVKISALTTLVITFLFLTAFLTSHVTAQKNGKTKPTVNTPQTQDKLVPIVRTATRFDKSPALRTMKPLDSAKDAKKGEDDRGEPGPVNNTDHDPDGALQRTEGKGIFNQDKGLPPTGVSFDGMIQIGGSTPPDPNGDVGPNHFVQTINSRLQVWDKMGNSVFGPVNINTLWAGFGGACQNENSGDPVVLHDQLADRWLITQFTSAGPEYFNCVALSQTSDPTGAYYRYAFSTGAFFPDYPKWGIGVDGYYLSTREFGTPYQIGAYVVERDQMLLGNPTPQYIGFQINTPAFVIGDGILPADVDGNTLPPKGSPHYFVGSMDDGAFDGAPADALNLFKFAVDWGTPANSTFAMTDQMDVAAVDTVFPCTPSSRACIPQPNTTRRLDILSYRQRPLHRFAYRNLGTHESLVVSQSVEATAGVAGMRWYEIRSPNSSPVIHQQGTYSPDNVNRWMGSIAMDRQGNMLMGYSVSDDTSVFPGLRFTGRLFSDPLGTMPQGEGVIIDGAGTQESSGSRWGDYSSMTVDPVDDCTFWYTNEYYTTTSTNSYRTRISSVTFPGCVAPNPSFVEINGRVTDSGGRALPNVIVNIQSTGTGQNRFARSNSFGNFRFSNVQAGGNYTLTAESKGNTFLSQMIFVNDNINGLEVVAEP